MKQVVKVSISGVSFSLESDAYTMLEKYLSELNEPEIANEIHSAIATVVDFSFCYVDKLQLQRC